MSFQKVINKYRTYSGSQREKGDLFEKLMVNFLRTYQVFDSKFRNVWQWTDFPYKSSISVHDVGIDLVALTADGEFIAVQCKCYKEDAYVDKAALDSFIASSGRWLTVQEGKKVKFASRLLISTSNKWSKEAESSTRNQDPPFSRISLTDLEEAQVNWEAMDRGESGPQARIPQHEPKEHQKEAIEAFHRHFKTADRGRLILPCGTGKTFTALRIAERETGGKGLVVFMAPSIALVGQTLKEWAAQAKARLSPVCVCSDAQISTRKYSSHEDPLDVSSESLPTKATTSPKEIADRLEKAKTAHPGDLRVVFSTYQSAGAVSEAIGLLKERIDLLVCDEAHRTTGQIEAEKGESQFVKVHDQKVLPADKRLYMTATPRIYSEPAKRSAAENSILVCSMDDPDVYGEEVYRMGFGDAVRNGLLSDYKVLLLTIGLRKIPPELSRQVADGKTEIDATDAIKLIGCIHALSKRMDVQSGVLKDVDPEVMHKAVAFCAKIKDSKSITDLFNGYRKTYLKGLPPAEREELVAVAADHIDGTMGASTRDDMMSWLKNADRDSNDCRILSNCRCLSTGVDVPSLDAVLFLSAKNSEIEVVQSVGRVMRLAPGKKFGYVIIPIVVHPDVSPEKALSDNAAYKVVWEVLNALKSHDDRFNAKINQIRFNETKPEDGGSILIGGPSGGGGGDGNDESEPEAPAGFKRSDIFAPLLDLDGYRDAIYAKLVRKVGTRSDLLNWAGEVGHIARIYAERIRIVTEAPGRHRDEFGSFLKNLQENLNPSVDADEAVRMLAQHMVTKPVFEALFENYSFARHNPVSVSMQGIVDVLDEQSLRKDAAGLEKFYDRATGRITALESPTVREFVTGIDNAAARQKIIVDLYDSFFRIAFPDVVERLGVVYTPVELVDFVIRSVAEVLKREFGRDIADEGVHVLDPFTGTGTFITRLIQSGLLGDSLERKYRHELHANEIVLLAYYIASINIENAYHAAVGEATGYAPFGGICLTDTFQLYEEGRKTGLRFGDSDAMRRNFERFNLQKQTPIMVILGNPPYSAGQKSANDNAQNLSYPALEERIAETYALGSAAKLKSSLYDTYVKAFRWASDRIGKNGNSAGVIAFVTNAGWLDGNAMDGMRKCLVDEFSSVYVFNLRGNQRTSGELSRKEGGKIFGSGSRAPIAITVLIKNPDHQGPAEIFYHDIGDYLSRERKLEIIAERRHIFGPGMEWGRIVPNEAGDWLNQRSVSFENFIPLGDKDDKQNEQTFFAPIYSNGVKTQRDTWCYNYSSSVLQDNIRTTIKFYNEQRVSYHKELAKNKNLVTSDFISFQSSKINWTRATKENLTSNIPIKFNGDKIIVSQYRPFQKIFLYFDRSLNEIIGLLPKLFPTSAHENVVISVSGTGATKNFSCLIADKIPDLHFNGDCQCFPRYYYEKSTQSGRSLLSREAETGGYVRRDGITDFILKEAKAKYGREFPRISKDQIFHYVYGLLHSQDYRTAFAADLKKMLPRLPLVEKAEDFQAFSQAGKSLAKIHLNYETVRPHTEVKVTGAEAGDFLVQKMRFGNGAGGKDDRTVIHYNDRVKLSGIPLEAYEYVVNGKSPVDWVMERYQVKTDTDSGITNDPNAWSEERGEPRYILDLLLRVIKVSLETNTIVNSLPRLKFEA